MSEDDRLANVFNCEILFITSYGRLASTVVERDAERVGSAATVRSAIRV